MARYIDEKYLFTCETCRRKDNCTMWCENGECYTPNMSKIPTADVVEVVRCKDCQKYEADTINPDVGWCKEFEKGVFEDGFCSYGERKE